VSAGNGMKPDRSYVLYVGSLSKRKNFQLAFETACRLARKRGYNFVFVGGRAGGISKSVPRIPDDVRSNLTFAGQIDNTVALMQFYRDAACLLFPSYYEASPLPPIEAMACGCPVIASDIPSLRERCGDAAIYCNPIDIDSIMAVIERVIDDPILRGTLVARGYKRATKYTWESCAAQTLEIICRNIPLA
jgi:glycosyltransferase involved in cell wall biosynthesis